MDPESNSPVVQCIVDRLFRIVENHVGIETVFKDQLEEIKCRLSNIMSFLADTDNLQSKKEVLKTCLKNLRNLIYEAEDLLTDCALRYGYTKKLSCERIMTPFFKCDMGKKLRNINSRMKEAEAFMGRNLTQQANREESSSEYMYKRVFTSQDFNSSEKIGLEEDLIKIRKWILWGGSGVNRIGIVGMGGLGKTTIAQKVFMDMGITSYFDERIWLSVSQSFNEKDMLRCILKQLGQEWPLLFDEAQMFHKIRELLCDKSYLIVLDDVWDTGLEWSSKMCSDMPIPNDDSKSGCIIVTTWNEGVAFGVGVNPARIHKPKLLNRDDSWCLFCKYAFLSTKSYCPTDHFEEIGRTIVERCGGLPLAIKTIGALLASKTQYSQWMEVKENFHGGFIEASSYCNPIMASLRLSYAELPSLLKQCLMSFSIYPEDAEIEAEQLIYWWVGEGLIFPGKNNCRTAVEYGYAFLSELAQRFLIEVTVHRGYDGRIFKCRMQDLVRILIAMMAEEEGFCSFDEKGSQKVTLDRTRWLGLTNPINEHNLSLMKKICDQKLRALLFISSSLSTCCVNDILELQLKSLRVLDVSHSEIKLSDDAVRKKFWAWITSLRRLVYLNLSDIADLRVVPSSIRKLLNLQLLVLRGCTNLRELHSSVTALKQLIVLDIEFCPKLPNLPRGIQNLSNLQELSGLKISNKSFFRFIDVKELANLRELRIHVHDESVILAEELPALSNLVKLKVLAISYDDHGTSSEVEFKDEHAMNMLDHISPPPALQELYLKNFRRENLWSWINPNELSQLLYLSIEEGNLVLLSCTSGQLWKIEGLCLKFLQRLQVKWKTVRKDMPFLHWLEVSHCIGLRGFPFDVAQRGRWKKDQSD